MNKNTIRKIVDPWVIAGLFLSAFFFASFVYASDANADSLHWPVDTHGWSVECGPGDSTLYHVVVFNHTNKAKTVAVEWTKTGNLYRDYYKVPAHQGVQTVIRFKRSERLDSVVIGTTGGYLVFNRQSPVDSFQCTVYTKR